MQKLNCHLQKSKELFSPLFKNTALKTGEEPHTNRKSPPHTSKWDWALPTTWKQSKISFKFKRSFTQSHPSICPANIVCWLSLATQSGKESEAWPDLLPQGPGAPEPSEQMQTGYDLILTQKTRQWRQVRKWTSLKGLTLYTGPKSQEERPFQSLPKEEKTEHFMAQPWHSDPQLAGPIKSKPFQTSNHATHRKKEPQSLFVLT